MHLVIGEQDLRMDRLHQVPGGDSCLYGGGRSLPEGVVEGGAAIRQVGIDLERKNTQNYIEARVTFNKCWDMPNT